MTGGAPFYKVLIDKTGEDVTAKISKFNHEDATDADNLLTLHFFVKSVEDMDNIGIREGTMLKYQYGYIAGKVSPVYVSRAMNIKPGYASYISLIIEGGDAGVILKKQQSKQTFDGKTSSQIVRAIAAANGLKAVVDNTTKVHGFMPQAGTSDYQFLKKLAEMEEDGSFRFYTRSNELHFTRLNLKKPSVKTFTYGDPNGDVISFYPYSKETMKNSASRNTVITTVDPLTNKPVQNVVNNQNAKDNQKLGDFDIFFNANGEEIAKLKSFLEKPLTVNAGAVGLGIIKSQSTDVAGKHMTRPVVDLDHALNLANSEKKKEAMFDYEATLTIEGNPQMVSDTIVTMAGVAQRDLGNWYVLRVDHAITPEGGYETRLTLGKNSIKKPLVSKDKAPEATVNKTVGPDETKKKKEIGITIFNEDAVEVGKETQPVK